LPITFESRRRKLQRFLKLPQLTFKTEAIKVILISSAKTASEIPLYFRLFRWGHFMVMNRATQISSILEGILKAI
jgi:hypothetical protein